MNAKIKEPKQTDKQKLMSLFETFGVEFDTNGDEVVLDPDNDELAGRFYFNDDGSFRSNH